MQNTLIQSSQPMRGELRTSETLADFKEYVLPITLTNNLGFKMDYHKITKKTMKWKIQKSFKFKKKFLTHFMDLSFSKFIYNFFIILFGKSSVSSVHKGNRSLFISFMVTPLVPTNQWPRVDNKISICIFYKQSVVRLLGEVVWKIPR